MTTTSNLPSTAKQAADSLPPVTSAYDLLSKPTLDITDAEAEIIVSELRKRREQHLATGRADKPKVEKKIKAEPASAEAKKANTAALLAQLKI